MAHKTSSHGGLLSNNNRRMNLLPCAWLTRKCQRWCARWVAVSLAAAIAFFAGTAHAQQATLVLVTNHKDATIIPLLRSELESLGLRVETVDKRQNEVVARDLQRAAREHHAVAAIRVLVSSGTVELWIADRVTGKVVLRDVLAQGEGNKISESTVALQAVELLRASLLEVEAPHPPRGEVTPPPALYNVVGYPESTARLRLEISPALLASIGGVSPLDAAAFEIGYRVSPYATAESFGAVSVVPGTIRDSIGTAKLHARSFTLGIEVHGRASATRWQPFARLGAGVLTVSAQGDASSPYVGYQRDDLDVAFIAAAGSRYRLTRNMALSATLHAIRALHPLALQFDDRTVARFGALVAVANIGIVLSVP
jgi:hypothetical protein